MNSEINRSFSWSEPKKESTSIATYSSLADGKSHIIGAFVKIDGKEVFTGGGSFSIKLIQKTLDHSTLTIHCRADEFDSNSGIPMSETKYLGGKKIYIEFKQFNQTTFYFNGLITEIKRRKQGQDSFLTIRGISPDALLEDGAMCQSFENKTLDEIVQSLSLGLPSDLLTIKTKPKYKDRISYTTQYQQTRYEYIQMLSKRYGEWLYWNGETLVFGGYGGKTVELLDSEDMEDYEIHTKLIPQNFSYQAYHSSQGEVIQSGSDSLQKQNINNHFQQQLIETSKDIYLNQPESYYNHSLLETGNKELSELVKRQKRFRENVLFIEAKTFNPNINIADVIKIKEYNFQSEVFKNKIIPMESYLVTELEHYFETGEGYYNTLKAIPHEQFIPPYYDDKAYPKAEKQRAEVTEVDDSLGLGRIRVQFPWQKATNQQTPWIRMLQPHSGADKGFNWKPEIGDEVMVDFESNSMDKPFVEGCIYNGKQKSGYDKKGNNLKVIKTRSGHIIMLDDTEDKLSITITDKAGNMIYFDTMDKSIRIEAPETIEIIAKNLKMLIEEKIEIRATDIITTAKNEITQNSIGKTQIHSSSNMEISADKIADIYGKQKLITYTKGNAEMGALGRTHVHGTNALFTAKNQLDYKAPQMGRLAQSGEFLYGKEKEITDIIVMDENFEKELNESYFDEEVNLLVHTRNYEEGEEVTIMIEQEDSEEEYTLTGTVDKEGIARIKKILFEKNEIQQDIPEQADAEDENKVYKTYKGKDYTKIEWDEFEEKQWEYHQYKKKSKGFFDF